MESNQKPAARRVVYVAAACVVVVAIVLSVPVLRLSRQCHVYSAELETQWDLIDIIARQVPDTRLQRNGIHALELNNIWGNVMDSDFYPARRDPRSLAEMKELTEQLRLIAVGATSDSAAVRLQEVYELLHDTARNKEFVSWHGEGDLHMLAKIAARNSAD